VFAATNKQRKKAGVLSPVIINETTINKTKDGLPSGKCTREVELYLSEKAQKMQDQRGQDACRECTDIAE
jgi:hypothetical protein